jgi:ABC-type amino acid transport substrate-binding protein
MRITLKLIFLIIITNSMGCDGRHHKVEHEQTFRRVKESRTLRCGYAIWPSTVEKNPDGTLGGIFVDYMNLLGLAINTRIEWTAEVPFADLATAISSGRVDAICAGIWPTSSRALALTFTQPIAYNTIGAYVRADETRINSEELPPDAIIATIDGELSESLSQQRYPKIKRYALPKMSDGAMLMLALTTRKADITFTDPLMANRYMQKHPGMIRELKLERPLAAFGLTIALGKGEFSLKEAIDTATQELLSSGQIEDLLKRYEQKPNEYLRVREPYRW